MTSERPNPDIGELMARGERLSRLVSKRERLADTLSEMTADPSVSVIRKRRLEGVMAAVEEAKDRFGNLLSQTTEQLDQVLPQAINQAQEELTQKRRDLARVTNMAARGRLSLTGDDLKAFGGEIAELETKLQRLETLRNRRGEPAQSAQPLPTPSPTPEPPVPPEPQTPEVSPEQTSLRASQREPFQVELGGIVISGRGRATKITLEAVADTSKDRPIDLKELALKLYGIADESALDRARSNVSVVNPRLLKPLGLVIGYDLSAGKVWLEVLKPEVLHMADSGRGRIRVGERVIEITQRELAVLAALGMRAGQEVVSSELSRLAFDDLSAEHSRLRDVVAALKHKLNLPGGPEFIVSKAAVNKSWVKLQGAEVISPKVLQEEAFPLETSRVDALRLILENSNVSLEQVKAVLDPEGKFPPGRVIMSLHRACTFLLERVKMSIETPQQKALIEMMVRLTRETDVSQAIREIDKRLEEWFRQFGEVVETRILRPEPVTLLEASALAKLIEDRVGTRIGVNGSSFYFEIAENKKDIFEKLRNFWKQEGLTEPVIPLKELVNSALLKVSVMVRMNMEEKVNYIVDEHQEVVAELLDWFYFQNTERMQGVLADFLSSEVGKNWREGRGGLVEGFERVWPQTAESTPDRAVFEPSERPPVPAEPVVQEGLAAAKTPETPAGLTEEELAERVRLEEEELAELIRLEEEERSRRQPVAPPPFTVEPPTPSSRVQQLERRLPDVKDQVRQVIDGLAAQNSLEPITGARVSQIFNSITATVMGKAEGKRFVAAQRVHSGGHEYPVEDVVVLVVMNGNRSVGWDNRLVDALKGLANQEMARKLKELEEARKKKLKEQQEQQGQ